MARQDSKRGLAITKAAFEAAWDTHIHRFGFKGLNLGTENDTLAPDELSRMSNVVHRADGGLTSRKGQTSLSTAGTMHHSMRRLNDPANNTWTRFHGVDTTLRRGQSGALSLVDSGYSGDPLTMVPHRTPFSGQPWMFIADRSRMRKVSASGTVKQIGLPAPEDEAVAVGTSVIDYATHICSFEDGGLDGDNSSADDWTSTDIGASNASTTDILNSVNFILERGGPSGNRAIYGTARSLDLTVLDTPDGPIPATDADLIRMDVSARYTDKFELARVYLVCSATFDSTVTPGTGGTTNSDYFMYELYPDSFPLILDATLKSNPFGNMGYPLYRSDFQRFGVDNARGWGTITGIIIETITKEELESGDVVHLIFADMMLCGGGGPDTTDPVTSPYDYRYTDFDTTTGAESNPSPIMDENDFIYGQGSPVTVSVPANGDSDVRQKIYRRGGTLVDNWYYVGMNDADGADFVDNLRDAEIALAGTLETDNYQPVPTVDTNGETVLAQALPALWGPLDDFLFACGDPYRPGFVYFSKRGRPDSWPDSYVTEVCSSSEELMMGGVFGGQSFVFSKERMFLLYPNLSGDDATVTAAPTQCKKGMINRWGVAVGAGGIWFINRDGIYRTSGGPEDWISKNIDPLFRGRTVNGYKPISFAAADLKYLRLEVHENALYFLYKDSDGNQQVLVFEITFNYWRHAEFGRDPACFYSDEGNAISTLLIGGNATGATYTYSGTSDAGLSIAAVVRTGRLSPGGGPRDEKILGDQILDADSNGVDVNVTNYLNDEVTANAANTFNAAAGRKRAIFDVFGTAPQRVRNIATHIDWTTNAAGPTIYQLGTSAITEPEVIINRVTQWDDLGHADESYVTGVTLDIDTHNEAATFVAEADFGGAIVTLDTFSITANGRRKFKRSWTAGQANKVRLRPTNDCVGLVLYKVDWIFQPEPPRISKWDVHFENQWDAYYTGLDIYCDTGGQNKTVKVYVDGTQIGGDFTVNTNGRKVHHITLPAGRGHVFRFVSTDSNDGLLYDYRWHLDKEPSEQANWNQNFTVAGTEGDKFLKALVLQCDTFGQNKTVTVEIDGSVVGTHTVNTSGRKVVQIAFAQQLGRVFRLYPTDSNPGRLYSINWVFDQEPLKLDRWETQEQTHTMSGWHYPIYGHITLKSTADVTLTVTAYNQSGVSTAKSYTITSTSGAKIKKFVPFEATKGIMYKYVLTSAAAFWLYREETSVLVREWGTDKTLEAKPFGNDDNDPTRGMSRSELAAGRGGGTA